MLKLNSFTCKTIPFYTSVLKCITPHKNPFYWFRKIDLQSDHKVNLVDAVLVGPLHVYLPQRFYEIQKLKCVYFFLH